MILLFNLGLLSILAKKLIMSQFFMYENNYDNFQQKKHIAY